MISNNFNLSVLVLFFMTNFISWLNLGVRILGLIFLTPLLMKFFSAEEISVWFLFLNITAFILMLDFGFTPVIIRFYAFQKGYAKTKRNNDRRIFIVEKISDNINFFIIIVGVIIILFLNQILIKNTYHYFIQLLLVSFVSLIRCNFYKSYLEGCGYIKESKTIELFVSFCQILFSIIVLISTKNLLYTLVTYNFIYVIQLICFYFFYKKIHTLKKDDFSLWRVLLKKRGWVYCTTIDILNQAYKGGLSLLSNLGIYYFIVIFVATKMDPNDSAIFLIIVNYARTGLNFCVIPLYNKIPYLSGLYTAGDFCEYISKSRRFLSESCFLILIFIFMYSFLFDWLISALNKNLVAPNNIMIFLICLCISFERIQSCIMQTLATMNVIIWDKVNFLYGFVSLTVFLLTYNFFTIYISFIVSFLIASFFAFFLISKERRIYFFLKGNVCDER